MYFSKSIVSQFKSFFLKKKVDIFFAKWLMSVNSTLGLIKLRYGLERLKHDSLA